MSELITYHLEDGIATLTLSNGKVNAISPDVIAAFNAALDQATADRAVVIITGQPGILSGGYDLKVMTAGPKEAVALVTQGSTLARACSLTLTRSSSRAQGTQWPRARSCYCRRTTGSASKALSASASMKCRSA